MKDKKVFVKIAAILMMATMVVTSMPVKNAKAMSGGIHFELQVDYYVYNDVTGSFEMLKLKPMEKEFTEKTKATIFDSYETFFYNAELPVESIPYLRYKVPLFQNNSVYKGCEVVIKDYYIPEGYEEVVTDNRLKVQVTEEHLKKVEVYNPLIDSNTIPLSTYVCLKEEGTAGPIPKAPTVTVKAGSKKATISWKKSKKATSYIIYMSTTKTGKYKKIKTITDPSTLKYTYKNLKPGKTYYFVVKACNKLIYPGGQYETLISDYSKVKSAKILK